MKSDRRRDQVKRAAREISIAPWPSPANISNRSKLEPAILTTLLDSSPIKQHILGIHEVRQIASSVLSLTDADGRAGEQLTNILHQVEQQCSFQANAHSYFQDLLARVGVASENSVDLPVSDEPYWLRGPHPFANYQSNSSLPPSADVVIIGAGLTGASTAYHLAQAAKTRQLRVLILDRADPGVEASGRNGGNFELIPENSTGIYEGLAQERMHFLRRRYPSVPQEVLHIESERQASLVLGLALRNRDRVKAIIHDEKIDCDFCPRGWLYLAHTEREEQGICDEVTLAARYGERIEIWSRQRIREELGLRTNYLGRFIPGDGTYHPFKYVCGLLAAAVKTGVELYSRTAVRCVRSTSSDLHEVVTDRGVITAGCVIAATNAFTRELFPELNGIRPRQSQIILTEHAPDRTRGRVVTTEYGPAFFNQPRAGAHRGLAPLLLGGGPDRPMKNPSSRRRSRAIHNRLLQLRDIFYPELHGQPPSSEWIGAMAFTPDQLPAIGFLRPGVVIAVACNGYGGSYTTSAGQAAALMALTRQLPEWLPEDVFSPRRLLSDGPLFLQRQDNLWNIATAFCHQLRSVNQQIAEAVNRTTSKVITAPKDSRGGTKMRRAPRSSFTAKDLQGFPAFARFTPGEINQLLKLVRIWYAPKGSIICREGGKGGTCFAVVRGAVDVSIQVRGQQEPLARLPAGEIFGQVSLIDRELRSATCIAHCDTLLLEMTRDTCAALFKSRSRLAIRFLGVLNDGLVLALRSAERQLLSVNRDRERLIRQDLQVSEFPPVQVMAVGREHPKSRGTI